MEEVGARGLHSTAVWKAIERLLAVDDVVGLYRGFGSAEDSGNLK